MPSGIDDQYPWHKQHYVQNILPMAIKFLAFSKHFSKKYEKDYTTPFSTNADEFDKFISD